MPQYNVLTENWIPVEVLEGKSKLVNMLEVILHAHKIRCVKAASPLITYGIQRTLIAFLTDAIRPRNMEALTEIIGKGEFDVFLIEDYIQKCISEGTSFNLFDESHPFMQTPFNETIDTGKALVNKLFSEIPEGNNHTHFVHKLENEHTFTPAECAQIISTVPAFATNFGTNAYFSINGVPPIYFLYAGRNLFETLSTSMLAESEHEGISLDVPPIAWRNFSEVEQGGKVLKTSLLYGLTCQPRRIKFIPLEVDGSVMVKEMYYSKGWDFKYLSDWVDPYVVYKHDNKGDYALKAHEGKAVWRDIGSILSTNSSPKILDQMAEKLDNNVDHIFLHAFGMVGKFKGPVFAASSWFEESINFDFKIMQSDLKASFVLRVLRKAEEINNVLYGVIIKSIRQLQGQKGSDKEHSRYASLEKQAKSLYFTKLKVYIFGDFFHKLLNVEASDFEWEDTIRKEAGVMLKSFAESAFNTICNNLGSSAKTLEWRVVAKTKLTQGIYKELNGGWLDE